MLIYFSNPFRKCASITVCTSIFQPVLLGIFKTESIDVLKLSSFKPVQFTTMESPNSRTLKTNCPRWFGFKTSLRQQNYLCIYSQYIQNLDFVNFSSKALSQIPPNITNNWEPVEITLKNRQLFPGQKNKFTFQKS